MPTTKKRINISLPKDTDVVLSKLAKRDSMPQATKALHLIELALEIEEDAVLDDIASRRDKKRTKFLSHKQVWK